jgi:hypothetical protein
MSLFPWLSLFTYSSALLLSLFIFPHFKISSHTALTFGSAIAWRVLWHMSLLHTHWTILLYQRCMNSKLRFLFRLVPYPSEVQILYKNDYADDGWIPQFNGCVCVFQKLLGQYITVYNFWFEKNTWTTGKVLKRMRTVQRKRH